MPVSFSEPTLSRLKDAIRAVIQDLEANRDIRVALGKTDRITDLTNVMVDVASDSETRFVAFLMTGLIGLTGVYEGKTEKWYELNIDRVNVVSRALLRYMKRLSEILGSPELALYVDCSKDYFFEFHDATRDLTTDVKRG